MITIENTHPIYVGNPRIFRGSYTEVIVQIHTSEVERVVRLLDPIPEVIEPRHLGAVISAKYLLNSTTARLSPSFAPTRMYKYSARFLWVFDGRQWCSNGLYCNFMDLIEPIIINDGHKGL